MVSDHSYMLCYLVECGHPPMSAHSLSFLVNCSHPPTSVLPPCTTSFLQFTSSLTCDQSRCMLKSYIKLCSNLRRYLCTCVQSRNCVHALHNFKIGHTISRLARVFEIPKMLNAISRLCIFPNCTEQIHCK